MKFFNNIFFHFFIFVKNSALSQPTLRVSWRVPYSQLIEEEKTSAWFTDRFCRIVGTTWRWTARARKHPPEILLKDSVERKPPSGQNFRQDFCLFTWLWTRNSQMCTYILIYVMIYAWLVNHGLGRNMTGQYVTKKLEKSYMKWVWMGKKWRCLCHL